MEKKQFDFLFAVIAPREVEFFSLVADRLRQKFNLSSSFLTFYEPGDEILAKKGYHVFSLHKGLAKGSSITDKDAAAVCRKYGLESLRPLLIHEKLTFQRFDESKLLQKVLAYDAFIDQVLTQNTFQCVVQELGGFVAPLSLYFNCRHHNVPHFCIEPALFRGRVFLNQDSLGVDLKRGPLSSEETNFVKKYVETYHNQKLVAIPSKDRHHFRDAGLAKLINKRNISRLAEKIYFKYIKRQREEYDAIGNHVRRNLIALVRRKMLSSHYSAPDYSIPYLYFPLHVPLDFQLTFRETRYLNQIALLEQVSELLPKGLLLYVKEHPASIGGYSFWNLRELLKKSNVRLIKPDVNSFDLIRGSRCVLTINSKVGAEAAMQGKPVLVLGKPYYVGCAQAMAVSDIKDLPGAIGKIRYDQPSTFDEEFFGRVFKSSFPGELYNNDERNLDSFTHSLYEAYQRRSK